MEIMNMSKDVVIRSRATSIMNYVDKDNKKL